MSAGPNEYARDMSRFQREISVAEFFEKNRHLLGFENPTKAMLTCVREAVDNSLDACEEAKILPEIYVEIKGVNGSEDHYLIVVEDNGPGIIKSKVPYVFGKLLFGSKFHRLKQSRGQQGIGISGAVLYAQLTTGKPTRVYSRVGDGKVHVFDVMIDTRKNEPRILNYMELDGEGHGVRIEMEVRGRYVRGRQSVLEYLRAVSLMNPFAQIVFVEPNGNEVVFERKIDELPPEAKEIKPHPHGIEFGMFLRMLKDTKAKTLVNFFVNEFSRVGKDTAMEICALAEISPDRTPQRITREEAERIWDVVQKMKFYAPPTNCLSPVGSEAIEKSLSAEFNPEFVAAVSRKPSVYRGNPFLVEVGIAYGGDLDPEGPVTIYRFANKMPLLYEQSACVITRAIADVDWRRYGLNQPSGSLPYGPLAIAVHFASVWVPYTSEGKEAIAAYPEIMKEIKLALQEVGRKLSTYLSAKRREKMRQRRISIFMRYSPEVVAAIHKLTGVDEKTVEEAIINLLRMKGLHNREEAEAVAEDVVREAKGVEDITEGVEGKDVDSGREIGSSGEKNQNYNGSDKLQSDPNADTTENDPTMQFRKGKNKNNDNDEDTPTPSTLKKWMVIE